MLFGLNEGKHYDFTVSSGSTGSGLDQSIINIIESNTGTQVDTRVGYTQTIKTNGIITQINKYVDSTMAQKVYQIDFTWNVDGTPDVITRSNLDEGIVEEISFEWVDGVANINRSVV